MTPDRVTTEHEHSAQRMLRRVVRASPDAIYIYHVLRHRIAFLGHRVHDILGPAAAPRLALAELERLVHPGDLAGLRGHLAALEQAAEGEILSHELRLRGADGHYRWLCSRNTVLARTDAGRVSKVVGVVTNIDQFKRAKEALNDLSGQLCALREEERQRIAQELHDSTAQHLVAATLNLMTLRAKSASNPNMHKLLENVETSLEEATRELRAFTYLLHPLALENDGLERTLRTYLDGFARRTRLKAQISVAGKVESLPFALQCSLLRIIQEALANVHRHASATHVSISLMMTSDTLRLIVADDGCGIGGSAGRKQDGTARTGVGIPGMRARLREFGGSLEIHTGPHGTTLGAIVPLGARQHWGAHSAHERTRSIQLALDGNTHQLE
jgi:PAS domain S-box-containing protein